MHIARASWPSANGNGKVYTPIYLRESYRDRDRVRKRNIANLTHCDPKEVAAIELALQFKGNWAALGSLDQIQLRQGPSVGAVWVVREMVHRLGMDRALGPGFPARLAEWQIMARVLDQGSRLSAVRLAQVDAACEVLGLRRGFDEHDLYANLSWLSQHQQPIEDRLFAARRGQRKPQLFLYDATSSYLEGEANAYGEHGYNRDGKKGKKQIVIGLPCDQQGEPVSTEVFRGNTRDSQTFAGQVKKASERFGCERVTFVGDRGMIKSGQAEELSQVGFHYITAITKPQIEALLATGVLQMEPEKLLDECHSAELREPQSVDADTQISQSTGHYTQTSLLVWFACKSQDSLPTPRHNVCNEARYAHDAGFRLTSLVFGWVTPLISHTYISTFVLYWSAFLYHLFLASELSMLGTSIPVLMNYAAAHHLKPLAMGMIWTFACSGKIFVYQSGVIMLGYSYGYFSSKDLFWLGLCMSIVDSILLLLVVPLHWPLIGIV